MKLAELIYSYRFGRDADRIVPDMLGTHWRLYFKSTMRVLCRQKFMAFGEGAEFRPGAYAESCSKIGIRRNVVIRPGSFLFADPTEGGGGIVIEDDVLIGPSVHFYTNNHAFSDVTVPIIDQGYPKPTIEDSITVRRGAWIGAGSIILPGGHDWRKRSCRSGFDCDPRCYRVFRSGGKSRTGHKNDEECLNDVAG